MSVNQNVMRKTFRSRFFAGLILLGIVIPIALAQEAKPPVGKPPATPPTPAEQPTAEAPNVDVTNVQELRSRVGQTVTVVGDVARVGSSAGGNRFINFTGNSGFSIFISADDVGAFKPEAPEARYPTKTIAVHGKIERYRDQLQLKVHSPDQITIVEKKDAPTGESKLPAPVELKSISRNAWESPAGVIYSGLDPDGRTRREHVLRHAKDQPDREGSHGVFEGGEEYAFAWIDMAWQKIQTQKIKPEVEGDRETYTVSLGQKVGYLGGETGARRGHPPLTRVFLVVRRATSEIVTAFPK